jgi:hypothetical protein
MIGKKLSPVLVEIEETLWEFEVHSNSQPDYTTEGFRAATKIFMSALMDKIWNLQSNEDMDMEDRIKMVEKAGNDVKNIIKIYTDIDTHELYKQK